MQEFEKQKRKKARLVHEKKYKMEMRGNLRKKINMENYQKRKHKYKSWLIFYEKILCYLFLNFMELQLFFFEKRLTEIKNKTDFRNMNR